ncbi:MAG: inositol-3-phosphate synthase [Thermoproteota archaeon]|nr:inositol-3-phosphate synthase [Thermoproteota archaeon]
MRKKVRVAIAGVGNCASALVQGISYYHRHNGSDDLKRGNETTNVNFNNNSNNDSNNNTNNKSTRATSTTSTSNNISSSIGGGSDNGIKGHLDPVGLIAYKLGGIEPSDIEFVTAFDVVELKVGQDLADAIFANPNNTIKICDVDKTGIKVEKGEVLDGVGKHLNERVKISDKSPANVAQILKDSGAEILINYLPVGSRQATKYYVQQCLDAGVSFINAIPVFIASTPKWQEAFAGKNLACAGDDVMSQLGATVLHKTLVKLFVDRGVKIDETYQLNVGGDMDFYNMLDEERLEDKRISKTSAVAAMVPYEIPMRIGPSDFVGFLANDKICYINMRGKYFGNVPIELDVKLKVVDAYNSAGVMIDAIRGTKLAIDRGTNGPLESISAYCFKHPPVQMTYSDAKDRFMEFIEGKRDR